MDVLSEDISDGADAGSGTILPLLSRTILIYTHIVDDELEDGMKNFRNGKGK